MLYEWINGEKRQPRNREERTTCSCCKAPLIPVIPSENVKHWRHPAGDCDPWSEPEGQWHLSWKENFAPEFREVPIIDVPGDERHRADLFCTAPGALPTVVELQHSPISEVERDKRESFYQRYGRMFWLLHLHDEGAFHGTTLKLSWDRSKPVKSGAHTFYVMRWTSRSPQFIERWKRSQAHVFFDYEGNLFYLATAKAAGQLLNQLGRGQFALCPVTREQFVAAAVGRQ